jgi:hypothetical protein
MKLSTMSVDTVGFCEQSDGPLACCTTAGGQVDHDTVNQGPHQPNWKSKKMTFEILFPWISIHVPFISFWDR